MSLTSYPPLQLGNWRRSIKAQVPQKLLRDLLNRARYGDLAPVSDECLMLNPADIRLRYRPDPSHGAPLFRRRNSGLVTGGDWDLSTAPIGHGPKYEACRARFIDGADWEETALFDRFRLELAMGKTPDGCKDIQDLRTRYAALDALWAEVTATGQLRTQPELPAYFRREHGGIYVLFDRNADPIRASGGMHRFAIAQLAKLPRIPVQVGVVHKTAVVSGAFAKLRT